MSAADGEAAGTAGEVAIGDDASKRARSSAETKGIYDLGDEPSTAHLPTRANPLFASMH
jgi:hypothetical protein